MKRVFWVMALFGGVSAPVFADPAADEATLKKAGVSGEGPALLKFLKGFVPGEGGGEEIPALIKKMASEDFFEREESLKKVIALGPRAVPYLRAALKEKDQELVQRAEECLKAVEGGPGLDVHGATLRLIAARKPAGAAAVILEYLPFAPNERLLDEAVGSLSDVALEAGKPAVGLVDALADKLPARRAAAAEVLAKSAYKEHKDALHKLLGDDDVQVRLKTGVALAKQHQKEAIPILIDLLEKMPREQTASIETMLQKLAEYKGPAGPFPTPKALRGAWENWWTVNAAKVDLAVLTAIPKLLGRTLLVHANVGKVEEIGPDGKTLWEIGGLQFPTAAQMIGDDKVMILENRLRRATIRSIKGNIEQTITIALPLDAQVLPGGGLLVTIRLAVVQYNNAGAVVNRISMTTKSPSVAARRAPSGDTFVLIATGHIAKIDKTGKELLKFPVGTGAAGGGFDITPEGRILLVDSPAGKVLEFDTTGKVQREWKVAGATSAVRLANGNTLVCCGDKVVEINDRGTVVWEHRVAGGNVIRASKR